VYRNLKDEAFTGNKILQKGHWQIDPFFIPEITRNHSDGHCSIISAVQKNLIYVYQSLILSLWLKHLR